MSYINEALKKAQKERGGNHLEFGSILTDLPKGRTLFPGGSMWWISCIFVILVAIAFYSWFHFGPTKNITTPEPAQKEPEVLSQMKSVPEPRELYEKASLLQRSGRLRDAEQLYRKTLKSDPGYVDALNNLGVIYIHDKDFEGARRSLEKAIRLRPGFVDPYYNLACVYAIKGETRQSLAYLKKAISLDESVMSWARMDNDLQRLRGMPEFEEITGNTEAVK